MPVRNAPSTLTATLRFMGSRLVHRLRGGAANDVAGTLKAQLNLALAGFNDSVLRCDWVDVKPGGDVWTDSGLDLPAGARISLLAEGWVYMSRALDVAIAPKVGLWFRVGDEALEKIIDTGCSVEIASGGRLRFTAKPPGEFSDLAGRFESTLPRDSLEGGYCVAVIQWRDSLDESLAAATSASPSLFAPLLDRLRNPVLPPRGWNYLWRLGQGEIYRPHDDGHALCCHTRGDVGILQFPLHRPLTADTRLSWDWLVEQLPSTLPEHIPPTHDYLSIAVEFDNGLDLTWMWSCSLPVDTIFQCPLPWWDQRETHWVVRSGTQQLGQWLSERRSLLADYERAIGGTPPKNIVAVWLIANTAFQRGEGRCLYRGITITDAEGAVPVQVSP
ncbi:MAG: DUF3047 domain-containing protein [Pseudomonadota bacterium]